MKRKIKLISIISFVSIIVLTLSIIGIVNLNKNKTHSHKLSKIEAVSATCTEDGNIEYFKCSCGLFFTDENATFEIALEDTIVLKTGHHCTVIDQHEASCTEDAIMRVKCDECSYEYTDSVHAIGHAFSDWTETKEKTCETAGEEARVCKVCNYTETRATVKAEHDYVLVNVYEIDDIEISKYECSHCSNLTYTEGEKEPEPVVQVKQDLFDCSTDFSFVVYCEENEDYIKENLKIYDAYFENTEYTNNKDVKMEYNISSVDENYWLIKPIDSYQEGITYKIEANDKIILQENNQDNLYFTTATPEIVELSANEEDVIFIQNLENKYGGYLPYSINNIDDSEFIYVELNSKDYINIGDTICIGDITSISELVSTQKDCFIGVVKDIYLNKNGTYTLALSEPNMDELFDNVNLAVNQSINLDNDELSSTLKEDICNALYNDPEFISLIAAMDETTNEYATRRKLSSERVKLNDFFKNVKLTPTVKFENGKLYTAINGTFSLNIYSKVKGDTKVIGSISLQFKVEMEAGFDVSINYKLKKFAGIPYGINYFDVALTQTNIFGFDFNISLNMSSEYELGYIKDVEKNTIHFHDCKKVKDLIENNNYTALSNEDAYYEHLYSTKLCDTCKPFNNETNPAYIIDKEHLEIHTPECDHAREIKRTNLLVKLDKLSNILEEYNLQSCKDCNPSDPEEQSFKDKIIDKLKSCDWKEMVEKVTGYFNKTDEKEEEKKEEVNHNKIKLAEASVKITVFTINFDLYLTLDFDIKASLSYKYKVENKTVSGIRLQKDNTHTYKSVEKKVLNNELSIIGDINFEIGLDAEIYLSFVGLSKYIQAGFSVEAGIYSNLSGILNYDALNANNSYYAAYLEAGIHLDINLYYKLFSLYGEYTIYENKFKLLELGYDKVYYDYENHIEQIIIDTEIDVNDYQLFNVNYYDMNDKVFGTDVLTLDNNSYTVTLSLEKGEYLYLDGTKIYAVKNSPAYFEDKLIVNVVSNSKWNKYIKGSIVEYLETYEIAIIHDKTYNIILDNMGIGNEETIETKYAVIPSNLPVLVADDYTFAGWYLDKELTILAKAGDSISSNVTLYAKWHINLLPENYTFSNTTVTYDGSEHSIYVIGDLPAGVSVTYSNNKNINAGKYTVTAHFVDSTDTYAVPNDMTAVLTIAKADYDMSNISFDDKYTVFDGSVKTIEVDGDLPSDVGVSYENSNQIEVGVYVVTASFVVLNKNYNTPKDMIANLIIEKAQYDMTNITFEDKEVVYNEQIQTLEIIGELPEFINVEYINNENSNVGTYEITAIFTSSNNNYLSPENMVAYLTIKKASYDMTNITFEDKEVVYNGETHRLEIAGELDKNLSVKYSNNNKADAGEYEVIASFINSNNNYFTPSVMKATLCINKASYDMSNIIFDNKSVVYDSAAHSLSIAGELPQGVDVSYENNTGNINVGTYIITAKFTTSDSNYYSPASMTAALTINKASYDMSGITFNDEIIIYDGNAHSLAISGELPSGVEVEYENNSNINVGEYIVTAKFTTSNPNYNTPDAMNATLTISKIENALNNVKFEDKTVVYTGNPQYIYINTALPEGLSVEYSNNGQVNVGSYVVTAHFVDENGIYSLPDDMSATLTIVKAEYDMSSIIFENATVVYNGKAQALKISSALPEDLSVSYKNNSNINVGIYTVIAEFTTSNTNYNNPASMSATLTITKANYDMSNIKFENKTVTYNGSSQSIYISGTLPQGVSVSYENNSNIYYGSHEIIAVFATTDSNYNAPASMSAILTINKANYDLSSIKFENKTVTYNGAAHSVYITGTLPSGLSVSYTNNGKTAVGDYTVTAKFSTSNSNYNIPSSITAKLSITKADYDMSNITFTNKTVTYNGSAHSIYISGTLPSGVSVSYTGNGNINAGTYTVTANFATTNTNYNIPSSKSATLRITKANYDMSNITFTNKTITYNGSAHSINISGTLPSGLSVSYMGNSYVNAGTYTVIANFSTTNTNYNAPASQTATLTITKANYDMSNVKFYDMIRAYADENIYLTISGLLPSGVTVTYLNNGQSEIGSYIITANFATKNSNYNIPASKTATLTIVNEIIIDSIKYDYLSSNLTAAVSGYTDTLGNDITIPETISYLSNEYTINYINDEAFAYSNLDYVKIPSTVKEIGMSAFYCCKSLYTVIISEGVEMIEEAAFYGCINITSIVIPSSVKTICLQAFDGCRGIEYLVLNEGLKFIGDCAFYGCERLEILTIPSTVISLGAEAFRDCIALFSVTFKSGNTEISESCFEGCKCLFQVIIPESMDIIHSYAFSDCNGLGSIFYFGTPEQWKNITKNDNNDDLLEAELYFYSSTKPTDTKYYYWYYDSNNQPIVW